MEPSLCDVRTRDVVAAVPEPGVDGVADGVAACGAEHRGAAGGSLADRKASRRLFSGAHGSLAPRCAESASPSLSDDASSSTNFQLKPAARPRRAPRKTGDAPRADAPRADAPFSFFGFSVNDGRKQMVVKPPVREADPAQSLTSSAAATE